MEWRISAILAFAGTLIGYYPAATQGDILIDQLIASIDSTKEYGYNEYTVSLTDRAIILLENQANINHNQLADVYYQRACALYDLNRHREELIYTRKALEQALKADQRDLDLLATLYGDIAFSVSGDGQHALATEYMEAAWRLYEENKNYFDSTKKDTDLDMIVSYAYISVLIYANSSDESKMFHYLEKLYNHLRHKKHAQNGDNLRLAAAYNQVSEYYYLKKDDTVASLAYLKKGIDALGVQGNDRFRLTLKFNVARAYFKDEKYSKAIRILDDVLSTGEKTNDDRLPFFYSMKAQAVLKKDGIAAYKDILLKAITPYLKDPWKNQISLVEITSDKLNLSQHLNESRLWSEMALPLLDDYLVSGSQDHLHIAYNFQIIAADNFLNARRWDEFSEYIEESSELILNALFKVALLKDGHKLSPEVFNRIEKTRETLLWKRFSSKRKSTKSVKSKEIESLTQINNSIIALELIKDRTPADQAKLFELRQLRDGLSESVSNDYRGHLDESIGDEVSPAYQKLIDASTCILRFYKEQDQLYLIKIDQEDYQIYDVGDFAGIKNKVLSLIEKLKQAYSDIDEINQLSAELYEQLLGPIAIEKYNKLIIVKDHILHYLPFEILRNTDDYLVSSHSISYASSLRLYYEERIQPMVKNDRLGIFYKSFLNEKEVLAAVRSGYVKLLSTSKEALAIEGVISGDLYGDEANSKEIFLKHLADYDILHFATHAVIDDEEPSLSHLVFDVSNPAANLYIEEIKGLYLPAELVVMSACETGIGALANGNGISDMSSALTMAGVKSSVVSLWQVPDQESAELMLSFYQKLRDGEDKAVALTMAKREMSVAGMHPYYWAAWSLIGDERPLIFTHNSTIWIWIIIALLLMGRVMRSDKNVIS